jgi:hypothetical protein
MNPLTAITQLKELAQQARTDPAIQGSTPEHQAWRAKTEALLVRALGNDSSTLKTFRELRYSIGLWTGAAGEAARDASYFRGRVATAAGLIDAAVYELELSTDDTALHDSAYDLGLWQHVRHSVEEERWSSVSSGAVIYVEDKIRRWSGGPVDKDGKKLTGAALFLKALAQGGPLALGEQANETDGWRNLGNGLVAALGNVDRHNIQDRTDGKRYAMGIVGLCSLLLTQIRYQHPEIKP